MMSAIIRAEVSSPSHASRRNMRACATTTDEVRVRESVQSPEK